MRTFLRLAATLLLSLLLALPMPGGTTGIIEGVVRSTKSGETLPGVSVYISSVKRGAVTDANGRFTIQNIRIGTYDIRFTHPGFRAHLHRNVQIVADLRTRLQIDLEETDVLLALYNMLGQRVLVMTNERQKPGRYEVVLDGGNLPTGAYLYRLQTPRWNAVRKLMIMR